MNADGTGQTRLTDNPANDAWPTWSPDGTQIAFTSPRDNNNEIYVMNVDGTDPADVTRLTDNAFVEDHPAWSPDGAQIAFASPRDGDFEIYVINAADGVGQIPLALTDNSAYDTSPTWSPDGAKIAFASNRHQYDFEIFVMNADGTDQTRLTDTFRSTYPAWSPDGAEIAFITFVFTPGGWEIFTMNADGSDPVNRTDTPGGDFGPSWGVVPTPDVTAPSVAITTPADEGEYTLGSIVTVGYACEDEIDGSGLASCVGDLPDGALLDTSAVGPGSFTVTGSDNAGNTATATHDYTVVWEFAGFSRPIDNSPDVNTVKAGQAVPVKFSLAGDQGLDIFVGASPHSRTIGCDSLTVEDGMEAAITAGGSGLSYDAVADQYAFVWKTDKAWSGTCHQLALALADGTEHVANFQFR